jgi:hypothetical protein
MLKHGRSPSHFLSKILALWGTCEGGRGLFFGFMGALVPVTSLQIGTLSSYLLNEKVLGSCHAVSVKESKLDC